MARTTAPTFNIDTLGGLEIDATNGGVVVNSELQARSDVYVVICPCYYASLYKAGQLASFHDSVLGRRRISALQHSVESGRIAGLNMTGGRKPYVHLPALWFGLFVI